ncbi:MAG: DNA repair protein RecO [Mariprofundales bacterium]|nr:DNA repair protein RecO [Mariprofundales bacterium]
MGESRDQALLLRRIPFRESSLVLHLLTRDHGRITLMAKGARRANSHLRPHLTQLTPLAICWVGGARGMGTLTNINRGEELLSARHHMAGLELLALAGKLFRDGNQEGFHESRAALQMLAHYSEPEVGVIAASWLLLLQAGVISTLDHCWRCSSHNPPLSWVDGAALCQHCNPARLGDPITTTIERLLTGYTLADPHAAWERDTIQLGAKMIRELEQKIHHQGADR